MSSPKLSVRNAHRCQQMPQGTQCLVVGKVVGVEDVERSVDVVNSSSSASSEGDGDSWVSERKVPSAIS